MPIRHSQLPRPPSVISIYAMISIAVMPRGSSLQNSVQIAVNHPLSRLPPVDCLKPHANSKVCLTISLSHEFDEFMSSCVFDNATGHIDYLQAWKSDNPDYQLLLESVTLHKELCSSVQGWTAYRIGPFINLGGFDWTGLVSTIAPQRIPFYRSNRFHAFSQYALGNIDKKKNLIGYPPIHQHHFHLGGSGALMLQAMNNHGDNQCADSEGGVKCLVRHAPDGMAWMLRDPVFATSEYNDVRPRGATPLTSWIFWAFKLADTTQLARQIWQEGVYFHDVALGAPRHTYEISTSIDSIGWTFHHVGNEMKAIVESYMHTHAAMVEDVWLFQGNSSQVFSDEVIVADAKNQVCYGTDVIAQVGKNIELRQLAPFRARLVCSYKSSAKFEDAVFRKARCAFDPRVGREFVLVVFHRAQPTFPLGTTYRMHTGVRMYYPRPLGSAMLQRFHGLTTGHAGVWAFSWEQDAEEVEVD